MFEDYKFRASSLGKIMTNDRSGKGMGDTARTYLKEIYVEKVWGKRKDIHSKYISKGLMVEEMAIAFYSSQHGDFFYKNDEWFSNDFISGTPDIVADEMIIDIKSSWDAFTFMKVDGKNKDYFYQLQAYMWLCDKPTSKLAYVLTNTPLQLIEDEKRKLNWGMGMIDDMDEIYLEACAEIDKQHDLSKIPMEKRIKEFTIDRDEKVIEKIKERVLEAREYLETL